MNLSGVFATHFSTAPAVPVMKATMSSMAGWQARRMMFREIQVDCVELGRGVIRARETSRAVDEPAVRLTSQVFASLLVFHYSILNTGLSSAIRNVQ